MATFKTSDGKAWNLAITVGHLKKLREDFRFEPLKLLGDRKELVELLYDAERLVGVLYTLCETQAEKAGVTPEQFGQSFDGGAFDSAFEALLGAVLDFSPRSKVATRAKQTLPTIFDRMDKAAMKRIDQAMTELTSNDSAGSAAGPPALTPDPSVSASSG